MKNTEKQFKFSDAKNTDLVNDNVSATYVFVLNFIEGFWSTCCLHAADQPGGELPTEDGEEAEEGGWWCE